LKPLHGVFVAEKMEDFFEFAPSAWKCGAKIVDAFAGVGDVAAASAGELYFCERFLSFFENVYFGFGVVGFGRNGCKKSGCSAAYYSNFHVYVRVVVWVKGSDYCGHFVGFGLK
jgi:hypothetical protein